ncbi:MAG: DUF3617 domain-containing protein [Rhizobacter sp.]|nr:DUF3617 domain-containing protein [Rhizobacter sp.]
MASSSKFVRWRVVGLIAACAMVAHAQTAPPIKPGLWQVTSTRLVDGQKAPELGEHLKNLPPEARKRMEANMKLHGVDMSGGPGSMKMCMTRESLDQGRWQGEQTNCKTDFTSRTGSTWKWRSSCTQPPSESEGEASFSGSESYTVKSTTRMTLQGQTRVTNMTMNAKWLGADCGDLKPLAPPSRAPAVKAKP